MIINVSSIESNTTFKNSNTYVLTGEVVVNNNNCLTIEAGTVIEANEDAKLIIQKGGLINAMGTLNDPIIFTHLSEEYNWGGIEIHGGESLGMKSSGNLTYVSIRYAGLKLNEIGSVTQIGHIEVYNASDKGVEICGGSASINNLFICDCLSSLSISGGYSGGIQNVYIRNKIDGQVPITIEGDSENPDARVMINNVTVTGKFDRYFSFKNGPVAMIFCVFFQNMSSSAFIEVVDDASRKTLSQFKLIMGALGFETRADKSVIFSDSIFDGQIPPYIQDVLICPMIDLPFGTMQCYGAEMVEFTNWTYSYKNEIVEENDIAYIQTREINMPMTTDPTPTTIPQIPATTTTEAPDEDECSLDDEKVGQTVQYWSHVLQKLC
jgi:hypothetical protein